MKLTSLLLIFTALQVFGTKTYSQTTRLNVDLGMTTVENVLNTIESQSEFYFLFNQKLVDVNKKVLITALDQPIDLVLTSVFEGTDIDFLVLDKQIILSPNEFLSATKSKLQPRIITGTVTNEAGEPLIGVTIKIKGTTIGAISDVDGNYIIEASSDTDVLEFSYVGMLSQEFSVTGLTQINIILVEDITGLEEVVVVGYGTVKKATLTGSVANLASKEMIKTKSESLTSVIQGRIPGLMIRQRNHEPGEFDNYVSIRGYGSPLIVIDGVARDSHEEMSQINPNDVESISVLKDAAASIYGMNAANGVIIITTKKGLSGKPQFSYSNIIGWKKPTGLNYNMSAYDYRVLKNEMDRNSQSSETYTADILEKYRTGEEGYTDFDWIGLALKPSAFQQNHNFSIRGGNENIQYYNSFGYYEDNGLYTTDALYYKRYNFRSTTTAKLTKNLELQVSVSGRLSNSQNAHDAYLWNFKSIMVNDKGIGPTTLANEDHLTVIGPENKNVMGLIDTDIHGYRKAREFDFQSTIDLTYTIPAVPGLSLVATGAFDIFNGNTSQLRKKYDLYDYYTDNYVMTTGSDQYRNELQMGQRGYLRGQINYVKSANEHNISVSGIAEYRHTRYDELYGKRLYEDLYTNDILDQATSTSASNSGYRSFGEYAAFIGRLNYDYAGKYLIEGVARYDGSYRYAQVNRWAFFPSFSAGWRLSEESFIKDNVAVINNLKLRASYGQSGTDAGDPFEYIAGYEASSSNGYVFNPGALTVGMVAPGVVNDNLTWVTSTITNIGLDIGLWGNKLSGTFEVFQRKNEGLLETRIQSVPNTFGAEFPDENINSNMNHGFEFSLSHRNKIGNEFTYGISGNFIYSRLKRLHDESAGFSSSYDNWWNNDADRYTGWRKIFEWDGRYESLEEYETAPLMGGSAGNSKMLPGSYKLIDSNGDGIINDEDQTNQYWAYGTINPPMQFSMNLDASYKGFDLNILFQGASGYSHRQQNNDIWGYGRYPTLNNKFVDRYHTVNTTDNPFDPATQWVPGFYPAIRNYRFNNTTEGELVDIWAPKATYLRLKSLEVGYSIPQAFASKLRMTGARIYVNAFNLLTWTNKLLKDSDPERQEDAWNADLAYPIMKSFNFGVSINF